MHRPGDAVDLHSHWWPREFADAIREEERWHAWETVVSETGPTIVAGNRDAPAPIDRYTQDPVARAARRAGEGVVREALMVPAFLWGYELKAGDAAAYCRAVNADLGDLQRSHGEQMTGLGLLPLQDTDAALAVLEQAVKEEGLYAFAIGTNVEGRNLDDDGVQAVLDAVLSAGAAVVIHANWYTRAGADRMTRYMFDNSIGVPLEAGLAVSSLIYSGIMDRYPDARICCSHAGGWLAYGIGRMLLRYHQGRDGRGLLEPPDAYLSRFHYDCLLHDEESLRLLVRRVGSDRVVIGTDHPYGGNIPEVGAVPWIADQGWLTSRDRDRIVRENASAFLDGARDTVAGE